MNAPARVRSPKLRFLARSLLSTLAMCVIPGMVAGQEYRTVAIEGANQIGVSDINDGGVMVGSFNPTASGEQYVLGFVKHGEQVTVLQYGGAEGTQAIGINNRGDVVGWVDFDTDPGPETFFVTQGFRWSNGQFTLLSDSPRVLPYDINDAGTIVGLYDVTESPTRAFIQSGQSPQPVALAGLGGYFTGINDEGVIVGNTVGDGQSFRYAGGVASPLDLSSTAPADCTNPFVWRISNAGAYVGNCPPRPDGGRDSFAILGSSFQRIAFPGAVSTGAVGINASGTVVGSYSVYDPGIGGLRGEGFVARRAELLDPLPDLRRDARITEDVELLGTKGRLVYGVAADGVARVVVRIPADSPGQQFTVRLLNDAEPPSPSTSHHEDGELFDRAAQSNGVNSLVTNAVSTSAGPFAFVIYVAPADFPRPGGQDEAKAKRHVLLEIQAQGQAAYMQPIEVIRPPVLLVHGLWSDSGSWDVFSPLSTGVDTRFVTSRADFSEQVAVSASVPSYSSEKLARVRASSLGFSYNARTVDREAQQLVDAVRDGANPAGFAVASIQADVVGHSMGGAIARTLTTLPDYLEPSTFGQGRIHKLLTIDTPHLGTPVATQLLSSQNGCLRDVLSARPEVFGISLFSINNFAFSSAALADGSVVSGAVGDLVHSPLSPALQVLTSGATKSIPIAYVAGRYDQWSSLDSSLPLGRAAQIRFACRNSPLATVLTSSGWPTVFGEDSDGLVGRGSQSNGNQAVAFHEVVNRVHSRGTQELGFAPPTVLFPGEVPVLVVQGLNQPHYSTTFFRPTP